MAESTSNDDYTSLVYRWDRLSYHSEVSASGATSTFDSYYMYEDTWEKYVEPLCSKTEGISDDMDEICEDFTKLIEGGKAYLACNCVGILLIGASLILQVIWSFCPKCSCFVMHWIISICCILASLFFWVGWVTWIAYYEDNAVVENISTIIRLIGNLPNYEEDDAKIGPSIIISIVCSVFGLFACCMSCKFSQERHRNGPQYDRFTNTGFA